MMAATTRGSRKQRWRRCSHHAESMAAGANRGGNLHATSVDYWSQGGMLQMVGAGITDAVLGSAARQGNAELEL